MRVHRNVAETVTPGYRQVVLFFTAAELEAMIREARPDDLLPGDRIAGCWFSSQLDRIEFQIANPEPMATPDE